MGRRAGAGLVVGVLTGVGDAALFAPVADLVVASIADLAGSTDPDGTPPPDTRWYRWAIAVARPRTYRGGTRRPVVGRFDHGIAPWRFAPTDGPAHERPTPDARTMPGPDRPTRADALRRFAAEVSGRQDLAGLFQDVIDESFTLFGVDAAGLWTYDGSPMPLRLAAQRGLRARRAGHRGVPAARGSDRGHGGDARPARSGSWAATWSGTLPEVRERYLAAGIRTICYVPIVFGDETLGLLVLYHTTDYNWEADETELVRAFADHMATAISNARLAKSTRTLAERLRAISELAGRLNRLQDAHGVARAIVAEAGG